jgi:hypothetical protein
MVMIVKQPSPWEPLVEGIGQGLEAYGKMYQERMQKKTKVDAYEKFYGNRDIAELMHDLPPATAQLFARDFMANGYKLTPELVQRLEEYKKQAAYDALPQEQQSQQPQAPQQQPQQGGFGNILSGLNQSAGDPMGMMANAIPGAGPALEMGRGAQDLYSNYLKPAAQSAGSFLQGLPKQGSEFMAALQQLQQAQNNPPQAPQQQPQPAQTSLVRAAKPKKSTKRTGAAPKKKKLTDAMADKFLKKSGGDVNKALKMAQAAGFQE